MNTVAVFALMEAGSFDFKQASKIIDKLEDKGMTIYKKKVFKNGRRPATSQPLTPQLAKKIRRYYATDSDATQQDIANMFNVNIGRVNEALER
jgi:hypothetical protein